VFQDRSVDFEVGPLSALLEASATAVGVGMVLGGFGAGLVALLHGSTRSEIEQDIVIAGYPCAAFCLAVRLMELSQTI
jgi:hypothetical protein